MMCYWTLLVAPSLTMTLIDPVLHEEKSYQDSLGCNSMWSGESKTEFLSEKRKAIITFQSFAN